MLRHQKHKGFTLIELLVVIAIIAILAAILFPVFAKAREKARQTQCINNQKQIATAVQIYTQENEETLPEAKTFWSDIAVPAKVLKCPDKAKAANGYLYSIGISGLALGQLIEPENTQLTGDGTHNPTTADPIANIGYHASDYELGRHGGKIIVSFCDGHVGMVSQPRPWRRLRFNACDTAMTSWSLNTTDMIEGTGCWECDYNLGPVNDASIYNGALQMGMPTDPNTTQTIFNMDAGKNLVHRLSVKVNASLPEAAMHLYCFQVGPGGGADFAYQNVTFTDANGNTSLDTNGGWKEYSVDFDSSAGGYQMVNTGNALWMDRLFFYYTKAPLTTARVGKLLVDDFQVDAETDAPSCIKQCQTVNGASVLSDIPQPQ